MNTYTEVLSTSALLSGLRERLGDPKLAFASWQVAEAYNYLLSSLRERSFEEACQVGRPCFDYLRGHIESAGFEMGLCQDELMGWSRLWLFYFPNPGSEFEFPCQFIHIAPAARGGTSRRRLTERGDAFSALTGNHTAGCKAPEHPMGVWSKQKLQWKHEWTGEHLIATGVW